MQLTLVAASPSRAEYEARDSNTVQMRTSEPASCAAFAIQRRSLRKNPSALIIASTRAAAAGFERVSKLSQVVENTDTSD